MNRITLDLIHDLALLYIALAFGTEREVLPAEADEIDLRLRGWLPNEDPARLHHALREATLSYTSGPGESRIQEAALRLGRELPEEYRQDVLGDLIEIARADGDVSTGEADLIEQVRSLWNAHGAS